ncbi:hypothetical protein P7F88_19375 [Vibrio hannami]|uniref:hypothetical protein n=1 Tax=Vibrio hannami TaxID=2717094 RepID=UPI00240FD92E|nr:hypothetical protein [Vibrio hannami]MDG3088118.1 hypothetical protein [Vibrio hannami]
MSGTLDMKGIDIPKFIQVDEDLLSEADELDGVKAEGSDSDTNSGGSPGSAVPSIFDEDEEDLAGELIVEGIEIAFQFFGHEKYEISEGKKAMLEGSYAKLASKYGKKVPGSLGRFKEEMVVILLTLIVCIGGAQQCKKLREVDALEKPEADNGNQS